MRILGPGERRISLVAWECIARVDTSDIIPPNHYILNFLYLPLLSHLSTDKSTLAFRLMV